MKKLVILAIVVFAFMSFVVRSMNDYAADLEEQRRTMVAAIR